MTNARTAARSVCENWHRCRSGGAPDVQRRHVAAPELDDDALIAAIPTASLADYRDLADEVVRRRLVSAVPALEALCRRFRGLGIEKSIPEQIAALEALAAIGGRAAAQAVTRLIVQGSVQGPGLKTAITAAAQLGARLSAKTITPLLRHEMADVRAGACRCAGPSLILVPLLIELLDDADRDVTRDAACALGRMGQREAPPALLRLLQEQPTAAIINAVITIADEECLIIIGRIARFIPDLAETAIRALEDIGSPRALTIAAGAWRSPPR
jgi:HEAT repeat protein